MTRRIRRDLRMLKVWALLSTSVSAWLGASALTHGQSQTTKFDELNVERINIVESDGRVRLVLSNSARQAQTVIDGRVLAPGRSRPAGMIFFNEEGDEVGGVIFSGLKQPNGPQASGSLTFDQFKQDQTVSLHYAEGRGQRRAGLAVIDRPNASLASYAPLIDRRQAAKTDEERAAIDRELSALGQPSAPRMFVGKDVDGRATLALSDATGKQRLLLGVAPDGSASIRFLDSAGKVLREIVP
ncbi:MAG: hypothetical protein ABL961_00805 [Vicinamibacterales bacterium]